MTWYILLLHAKIAALEYSHGMIGNCSIRLNLSRIMLMARSREIDAVMLQIIFGSTQRIETNSFFMNLKSTLEIYFTEWTRAIFTSRSFNS